MGNFEKLSVLVIVVIIVMILVVALYTWTDNPGDTGTSTNAVAEAQSPAMDEVNRVSPFPPAAVDPKADPKKVDLKLTPGMSGAPGTPSAADRALGVADRPTPSPGPGIEPVKDDVTKTAPVEEPKIHVVASGETLSKIAKSYLGSSGPRAIAAIVAANPGLDANLIRPGMKVTIPSTKDLPAPATSGTDGAKPATPTVAKHKPSGGSIKPGDVYTVKSGDKLPDISRRAFGTTEHWHLIWLENFTAIGDPDVLPAGTRLKIPLSTR